MAITIPQEEMDKCNQLMRPAWIVAGLQNDLFSWEKEYQSAKRLGLKSVVNAIWVLMKEHDINVEEAKDTCRHIIKENVTKYLGVLEETKDNLDLSPDLRRYMEAMQYALSGNAVWSLICPRYHPTAKFNESQLLLMRDGSTSFKRSHRDVYCRAENSTHSGHAEVSSGISAERKAEAVEMAEAPAKRGEVESCKRQRPLRQLSSNL